MNFELGNSWLVKSAKRLIFNIKNKQTHYIYGALPAPLGEEPNASVAALFSAHCFLLFLSSVISLYNISTNSLINFIPLLSSLFSSFLLVLLLL